MSRGVKPPRGLDLRPERFSPPSPEHTREQVIELVLRAENTLEQYRWLFGALYGQPVGDRQHLSRTRVPDPAGNLALVSKQPLVSAYERILDAHAKLREAEAILIKALNTLDPLQTPEPWSAKSVNRKYLHELTEAQQRRVDRDEAIP